MSDDTRPRLRHEATLRDEGTLLPLVERLWPLIDQPPPAPAALPPLTPVDWNAPRPLLAREAHQPCPYNGGPREVQRLFWRDGDRALEVERREDLFASPSLHTRARGPAAWLDAVRAAVDEYLATHGVS